MKQRKPLRWFRLVLMLLPLSLGALNAAATETLTIAVASSLYAKLEQQAKQFEQRHDVDVRLVSGSTGRLYNQILQGAPFDIFIAADKERPEWLLEQGKALAIYDAGQGYLGLRLGNKWSKNIDMLLQSSVQHIAIANPKVAPFGLVAKNYLKQHGLWEVLKPKLVYAQNALQTSMLVNKGLVDAGFVSVGLARESLAFISYQLVLLNNRPLASLFLKRFHSSDRQGY